MKEIKIALPRYGISRYYCIAFVHLAYSLGIESPKIEDNYMHLKTKGEDIRDLMAKVYEHTSEILKNYVEVGETKSKKAIKGRVEIPVTGNERGILEDIKKEISLKPDASIVETLNEYARQLKEIEESEIEKEYGDLKGSFTSLSIFRPELYEHTRGPFLNGIRKSELVSYDSKSITLGGFMMRLSGFIISRVGTSALPRSEGGFEYITTLIMPATELITSNFIKRLGNIRSFHNFPNLSSPEGIIIWLSLLFGEDPPDVIYIGMKNPRGQEPASIAYEEDLPINSYWRRASRFLERLREDEECGERLLKILLSDFPDKKSLLSGLFLGSQGDVKSALEFILKVSRKVKSIDPNSLKDREKINEYYSLKYLLYLSGKLMESLKS
ncbi:MAG: hypothetical protein QXN53_04125 [Thermoproteota archaeon]